MDNQATEAKQIGDHVVHIAMDFPTEANHIDIVQQIVAQQIGNHVAELFGFMSKTDQQYIREAVQRAKRKAALKAVEVTRVVGAKTHATSMLLDGQPYTAVCPDSTTGNVTAEKLGVEPADTVWQEAQLLLCGRSLTNEQAEAIKRLVDARTRNADGGQQ